MNIYEERARETELWLKRHKDNPTYCIHFTNTNKLGINPGFRWRTPLGVASYPLKESWERYESLNEYPWGSRRKYIIVIDYAPGTKVLNVEDITQTDLKKLANLFIQKGLLTENEVLEAINKARKPTVQWKYWNITRMAAMKISQQMGRKVSIVWNSILRKILEFDIISDRKGIGILHPNEPLQVLFLHSGSWIHVKTLLNPYYNPRGFSYSNY